jgi:ParB family chromosome partitioning protein
MAARGLGKGLDSLIPNALGETKTKKETAAKSKTETTEGEEPQTLVKITKVEPNREQPRKNFDEDALQELADSIKQFGLLQPILVQDRKDYYEIIAGERRWRAAKLAGLKEVPVIIRNYTEQEIVEISLIENIQREDLNPIEEAQAYKRLLTEFHLKQDEVAERVSKSRAAVTNSIRLLKLNEEVQRMVVDEMISTGHARALLAVENPEEQYNLAQRIFDEKLSVRKNVVGFSKGTVILKNFWIGFAPSISAASYRSLGSPVIAALYMNTRYPRLAQMTTSMIEGSAHS